MPILDTAILHTYCHTFQRIIEFKLLTYNETAKGNNSFPPEPAWHISNFPFTFLSVHCAAKICKYIDGGTDLDLINIVLLCCCVDLIIIASLYSGHGGDGGGRQREGRDCRSSEMLNYEKYRLNLSQRYNELDILGSLHWTENLLSET